MLTNEFRLKCESIAVRLRHELGLFAYASLPARQLAAHLDVLLVHPGELPNIETEIVRKALDSQRWGAIAVPTMPPIVIYHPGRPTLQFESDVMHELAHLILGHKPEQLGKISDNFVSRHYPKKQEYEADFLADCLQLPKVGLQYVKQLHMTDEQIMDFFSVTSETLLRRMESTGPFPSDRELIE